jgi:putative ABC transport system ATP-binding protein
MALITTHNLTKIYDSGGATTQALIDVSLEIQSGEFVAIMGPSGSGKSTLMQILGLLDRSTSGTYLLEDKDTTTFSDDTLSYFRNQKIGFIFQSFNLLPKTRVSENVELPLLYSPNNQDNERVVREALESVGMSHRVDYLSNQLSGGEKQRVAIARALVNNPEVIFADEPTGNLDSVSGLQVMSILQKLNDEGKTIILVTHETFTAEHAKRIIRMKDGRVVEDGPVTERRFAKSETFLK